MGLPAAEYPITLSSYTVSLRTTLFRSPFSLTYAKGAGDAFLFMFEPTTTG